MSVSVIIYKRIICQDAIDENAKEVQALSKENTLLKNQLKKYITEAQQVFFALFFFFYVHY